jgi:uncharacterized protein (DUF2126 family)
MLVLLWGLETDPPLAKVREQLRMMDVPTAFVDQRRVLETEVELAAGDTLEGEIRMGRERIDLAEVTAVYLRPYESTGLPEIAAAGPERPAWKHAVEVDDIVASWSEMTSALVVNRSSAQAVNGSKPYQLAQIQSLGWSVPETLITTDPAAARGFWDHHGEVIYKSVSSIRSRVSRLRPEHLERLPSLTSCPTQFQRYIPGVDHRVHVVGEEVFACEVHCSADDYRYPDESPEIRACSLPPGLVEKCRNLAATTRLSLAGIDLRRTTEGDWFCFEVNPSPGFAYYEEATGQPIARSVARLLADAPSGAADDQPALAGSG